jgi:Polysaccharide biosynthesis
MTCSHSAGQVRDRQKEGGRKSPQRKFHLFLSQQACLSLQDIQKDFKHSIPFIKAAAFTHITATMSRPFDPEQAENLYDVSAPLSNQQMRRNSNVHFLSQMEKQFAVKGPLFSHPNEGGKTRVSLLTMIQTAVEHLMTYWSILEKVPGSKLRLTKMDDDIYEHFKREFPDFDPSATLNEDEMKSKAGKEKWRNFMNEYEKTINDFNFGTMLRSNAKAEYDQETTLFGKIIQYFCVWLRDGKG